MLEMVEKNMNKNGIRDEREMAQLLKTKTDSTKARGFSAPMLTSPASFLEAGISESWRKTLST